MDLQTFSNYINQLFFGIFTYEATPAVAAFLKRYVPSMAEKPQPVAGEWMAYPPGTFKEPKHQIVNNAYVFRQHPAIKGMRVGGKLSVTCKVYDKINFINVQDIRLWLTFNNENNGRKVFDNIVLDLSHLGEVITEKKINDLTCVVAKQSARPLLQPSMTSAVQVIFGIDNFRQGMFNIAVIIGDEVWPEILSMPV